MKLTYKAKIYFFYMLLLCVYNLTNSNFKSNPTKRIIISIKHNCVLLHFYIHSTGRKAVFGSFYHLNNSCRYFLTIFNINLNKKQLNTNIYTLRYIRTYSLDPHIEKKCKHLHRISVHVNMHI